MAQVREVRLIDDLNGSEAAETIDFSLDGRDYQVDLSEDNALKLRDSIAEFVAAARRAPRGPRASGRGNPGLGAAERPHRRRAWPGAEGDRRGVREGARRLRLILLAG
jgi:hypothetical protein